MTELFRILGTLAIDNDKANKAIDETTGKAEKSQGQIGSAFKKIGAAVVTYFATDKIIGFGKACVESAATVKAQTAQFEAAFKDLQGQANKSFEAISKDTGVLATRLKTVGTQGFSQFKGAGLEAAEALKKTDEFTRLAADGAAYYDMSLEETSELMRSFIRGNTEAGDRIGLFTSETQRNRAALDTLGKKYIECTEAEKQMIMLDIANTIYKSSGAMGQASREADGYENVVGNLKEAWRQFQAEVGKPILQKLIPILKSVTEKISSLKDNVGNITVKLKQLLPVITTVVAAFAAWKSGLAISGGISALSKTMGVLNGLVKANVIHLVAANSGLTAMELIVGIVTGKIRLLALAQAALSASFLATPIGMITVAVAALVVGVGILTVATSKQRAENEKLDKAIKKTTDEVNENAKAYKELQKTKAEQITSGVAELDYLSSLKGELDGLVDGNGKVKQGYEDRASFIINQLSEATGIEISLVNGVVQEYGKLGVSIDECIEKMRAKAIMAIETENYEANIRNLKKYEEAQVGSYKVLADAEAKYKKIKDEKDLPGTVGVRQKAREKAAKEDFDAAKRNSKKATDLVAATVQERDRYEKLSLEYSRGNHAGFNSLYETNAKKYSEINNMKKSETQKAIEDEKAALAASKANHATTGNEKYQNEIVAHQNSLAELKTHLSGLNTEVNTKGGKTVADFKRLDEQSVANGKTTGNSRLLNMQNNMLGINSTVNGEGVKIVSNFGSIGRKSSANLKTPFSGIGAFFKTQAEDVKSPFSGVPDFFKTTFDNTVTNIKKAFNGIGGWFEKLWGSIKKAWGTGGLSVSVDGGGGGTAGVGGVAARGNGLDFYKVRGMGSPRVHNNHKRKSADYSAPRGTPIPAQQSGVVSGVRVISTRERYRQGSYGRYVTIASGGKNYVYAHMNGFSALAKVGRAIAKGQVIGYVGQSGNAYGCHLHYGLSGYKNGGMPDNGEIFRANEDGIEMMGKMGKRPVISNNMQIVEGITAGVATGYTKALSQQRNSSVSTNSKKDDFLAITNLLKAILVYLRSDTNIKINEREFGRLVRSVNA